MKLHVILFLTDIFAQIAVILAKAGIYAKNFYGIRLWQRTLKDSVWIPAFAGMTVVVAGMTVVVAGMTAVECKFDVLRRNQFKYVPTALFTHFTLS